MDELAKLLAFLDHDGVTELVLGSNQPVTVRRNGSYIAVTTEPITQAQLARMLLGSPLETLLPDGEGIGEMKEVDTGSRMVKAQIARRGAELLIRVEPLRRKGASAARKPAVEERRQRRASQAPATPAPLPPPLPTTPLPLPRTNTIEKTRHTVADDPRNAELPAEASRAMAAGDVSYGRPAGRPTAPAPYDVTPMRQPPLRHPTPAPVARGHSLDEHLDPSPQVPPQQVTPPAHVPPPAPVPPPVAQLPPPAYGWPSGALEAVPLDARPTAPDVRAAVVDAVPTTATARPPSDVDLAPPHPYLDAPASRTKTTMAAPPPRPPAPVAATIPSASPSGTFEAVDASAFELPPPVGERGAVFAPAQTVAVSQVQQQAQPAIALAPPMPEAYELAAPVAIVPPGPLIAPIPASSSPPPPLPPHIIPAETAVVLVDERSTIEPMVAIVRACRERGVTDLHIAALRPVMVRAVGELVPLDPKIVTPQMAEALLLPLLGAQSRALLASRGYVDLAIDFPGAGRLRGNVSRHKDGLKGAFRLARTTPPTLDELGLPRDLAKVVSHHQGLVVISGPSGHGKTTTLNALVDLINASRPHHILMIEDPVEIEHPRKRAVVSQREVGRHTTSFAAALKASLREDPDVIVIGELRDRESVEIALTAAETGHLVMTTMSTPSAAKTIDRLIDMFPSEDQPQVRASLGGALRAIVAQRLLPRSDGRGLVAAVELITGVLPLIALIRDNKLYQLPSLMQRGRAFGMIRLDDSLVELVRGNTISEEVALRTTDSRRDFATLLRPADKSTATAAGGKESKKGGIFRRDKE